MQLRDLFENLLKSAFDCSRDNSADFQYKFTALGLLLSSYDIIGTAQE